MTTKGDVVRDYLEAFPQSPTLTLARMIYEDNAGVFMSVEDARSVLRYYRGAQGGSNKDMLKDKKFVRDFSKDLFNPFGLPESDEKEVKPFIIPSQWNNILVIGDLHLPYHSISAVTAALRYGKDNGVNSILLNGDVVDFHQLSKFVKDPRKRHFSQELDVWRDFIKALRREFPSEKIYYKQGNHEERYETYLKVKAPELYGIPEFEMDRLMHLDDYDIEYIKDKRTIKAGSLNILHGHELRGGIIPPVNPARGVFLRAKVNTVVNHWHTDSQHSERNLSDKYVKCWSIPCLCDLHPDYAPNNNWCHGLGHIRVFEDGDFSIDVKGILNGKIV